MQTDVRAGYEHIWGKRDKWHKVWLKFFYGFCYRCRRRSSLFCKKGLWLIISWISHHKSCRYSLNSELSNFFEAFYHEVFLIYSPDPVLSVDVTGPTCDNRDTKQTVKLIITITHSLQSLKHKNTSCTKSILTSLSFVHEGNFPRSRNWDTISSLLYIGKYLKKKRVKKATKY